VGPFSSCSWAIRTSPACRVKEDTLQYVASTCLGCRSSGNGGAEDKNLEDRDVKANVLLAHGALRFSPKWLLQKLGYVTSTSGSQSPSIILPTEVQRCLGTWLVESHCKDDPSDCCQEVHIATTEVFAALCAKMVSCACCVGSGMSVLAITTYKQSKSISG
jgi:hypothetical protein